MNVAYSQYSLHHRQGRQGPDPHRYSNLLTLCGSGTTGCHGGVTAHPESAFALGLSVRRLGDLDTRLVPVLCQVQAYALDDHGARIPLGTHGHEQPAQYWADLGLVIQLYPDILTTPTQCTKPRPAPVPAPPPAPHGRNRARHELSMRGDADA